MRRLAVAAFVLLSACSGGELQGQVTTTTTETTRPARATTSTTVAVAVRGPELTDLARPTIADRDPDRRPYNRDEWDGRGWADDDGDGCNTRAEVLELETTAPLTRKPNCTVLTGSWTDPFTGKTFTDASQVEIDHLVALSDAHASGGWRWTAARKAAFANDLDDAWHLNAVSGPENQRKADHGPDFWMPPSQQFRCTYIAAYAGIKARWGLTVTPSQWAAIERAWARC